MDRQSNARFDFLAPRDALAVNADFVERGVGIKSAGATLTADSAVEYSHRCEQRIK